MTSDMTTPLLDGMGPDPSEPRPSLASTVAILGSGDFSRSLAFRLARCSCRVLVGSRDPHRLDAEQFPEGAELLTQLEAAEGADRLVFAALHPEHYATLAPLKECLAGKVLVDVSNATHLGGRRSNAELLAAMFPDSRVVKAFNGISAWALRDGGHDGSRPVLICSDCPDSKAAVAELTRRLGFCPVEAGGLAYSLQVEEAPLLLFPSWGGPAQTVFLLFFFFYGYTFLRDVLLPYLDRGLNLFYRLPLVMVNKTLPAVALVTLALVYLPGVMAASLQLLRGTRFQRFPSWLDTWLRRRKQLGLLSFLCAVLHAIYSICLPLRAGGSGEQASQRVWRSDLYLSSGVLGLGVLSLLAVSSLPSVGQGLTWREFTFVQSGLGYAALTLSLLHTFFFGWDSTFRPETFSYHLPPVHLLALLLPCVVLLARLLLATPCLAARLRRIRTGKDRPPPPTHV